MTSRFINSVFTLLLFMCASASAQEAPAPVLPLPTPQQVAWQQLETYAFIHFGPNTFGDREWGYGDAPAASFNPARLDCEQWARTLKSAGMKGVIITAKHHDGFCLWPSQYTDYSVRNSPFRDGKGDVVGELAAACRKYGLKMGVYLSPWDRHQASYSTPFYVEYFYAQLEELLTTYGDLFEVWFDGANGGDGYYGGAREQRTIDRRTYYDFPRAHRLLRELQPQAIIFSDGGPGCRWVGNERGYASDTNWSFLRINEVYPGYDRSDELQTGHADGDTWVAAECDVSIRPGWFYHQSEDTKVKTAEELSDLYYRSVGRNATLLLNFPVDRDGLIHPIDSAHAVAFHQRVAEDLSHDLLRNATIEASDVRGKSFAPQTLTDDDYDTYWATRDGVTSATLTFKLKRAQDVNLLALQEYIPLGQRVQSFIVEYRANNQWLPVQTVEATTTIGYKRLLRFATVNTKAVRVRILEARGPICLNAAGLYKTRDYLSAAKTQAPALPPYKNAALSIDERLADLLSRMTVEEKVGQLRCAMGWNFYGMRDEGLGMRGEGLGMRDEGGVVPSEAFKKEIDEGHIGMLWATFRADPWTQKTLENGLTPRLAAEAANALQRYAIEHTRLGIPLFLAEEAPHGHMAIGTTVFPTGLAMAATWSPELIERVGKVIGSEIRQQGGHISYGPVLDLARDPRWSRTEETFGEDPVLAAELGAAMVRGLGGGHLSSPDATIATLKHFIAYGASDGGQNGGPTTFGQRELHESFLPPFRKAIEAGALSVMTSYNAVDGIPCTSNDYLLSDILRNQWHFRGFVVSDLYAIDGLAGTHRVAANRQQAALMALKAGVDVDLGGSAYSQFTLPLQSPLPLGGGVGGEARERGVGLLDSAVARVLRLKFEMGLFEHPYVDPNAADAVGSKANKAVALDVARAAVTLLKNNPFPNHPECPTLPLKVKQEGDLPLRVLVCGPNADNRYNLLGDYTAPQADGDVVTILDGIRAKLPAAQVEYVKGCAVRDTSESTIAEAVAAASRADVIVCCVGGSSARDFKTSYVESGAAVADRHTVSDMDCGEGFDRATLTLLGHQQALLEALKQTGKPLIVVYIEGRPLDKRWAAENADALLTAYYPGGQGGTAIADVLFGDYNPAGRLPMSVPVHVGQLPVYYNKKVPRAHEYIDMSAAPLYPFGYGLSYTTFDYKNLRIEALNLSSLDPQLQYQELYRISVDVTNTGSCDGEEVVQLYLRDDVASTVQPIMQLKAFQRLFIPKGETRTATMTLSSDDFAIIDNHLRRVIEPGSFTLMIGSSSAHIHLRGTITYP